MDGMLGFLLAAIALAGSPGPATLSLAATGAAFGVRRGLGYLSGIVLGLVLVIAIVATGVMAALLTLPHMRPIVSILAALYFIYLACRIATAPPVLAGNAQLKQPSLAAGIFLSLINPKGYVAVAALFSGFVAARDHVAVDLAVKVTALITIIVLVSIPWLFAGAALTRLFRQARSNRIINVIFAILLIASVGLTLLI